MSQFCISNKVSTEDQIHVPAILSPTIMISEYNG
jgi:hypothetical protein